MCIYTYIYKYIYNWKKNDTLDNHVTTTQVRNETWPVKTTPNVWILDHQCKWRSRATVPSISSHFRLHPEPLSHPCLCEDTLMGRAELRPSPHITPCPHLGTRGVDTSMTCPACSGGKMAWHEAHTGAGSRLRSTWVGDSTELGSLEHGLILHYPKR